MRRFEPYTVYIANIYYIVVLICYQACYIFSFKNEKKLKKKRKYNKIESKKVIILKRRENKYIFKNKK